MNSNLTTEQKLIQQTIREITKRKIEPKASEIDEKQSFPWEGLNKLAESGVLSMMVPSEYGGTFTDSLSFLLTIEEISKACASTSLISVMHASACKGILLAGNNQQKHTYLPMLSKGEKLGALAVHEANSGVVASAIETTAIKHKDEFIVNGSKIFTTSAGEASVYLVLVITDKSKGAKGISMLLIEKDTPGFSWSEKYIRMGLNGTSNRELIFENCKVPKENLLGKDGDGLKIITDIVGTIGMLGVGAISLGLTQAAFNRTITHSKERLILNQPIGANQAIQLIIADMGIQIDAIRSMLYDAAIERDKNPSAPYLNSFKAKLFATESAIRVIDKALQIHGGHGYCKDFPIERYYRDARGLTLHFVASELLKANIGKMIIGLS
jgi:alkylation response protein AidB-like acyl-CoA dehydrogenase